MKRKILLFDTSSVLHAAKHSLGKARLSHNDRNTFVIYGFMLKLHAILAKEYYDIAIFALDSRSSKRKDIYAEYKENRSKSTKTKEQIELDELAYPQFEQVEKFVLPNLGFKNLFKAEGYEADDIIARICHLYREDEITIITSDKDMYQLLAMNVSILKPREHKIYNIFDFKREYGIDPQMWKRVKVYGGCTTDNVSGLPMPQSDAAIKKGTAIRNVGEGTALNYIKGTLGTHTNTYKAFTQSSAKKIIARNKKLVILPFYGTPKFTILPDNRMSKKGLVRIIREYNFKSIEKDFDSYCKVLKLR